MAIDVDLDFQRYVERRKGAIEAQAREGAAYAYSGDLRVKRTLDSVKPVRLAVESAARLWKSGAKADILGAAVKVTPQQHPRVDALANQAAKTLHIARPTIYVAPALATGLAHTLGTDEDPSIVIDGRLVEQLTDPEMLFLLGHQCGHIQNNHVVFTTALYYLQHAANRFIKWIVSPAAAALRAWSRRAELSCDRAGLIACTNLDAAEAVIHRSAAESKDLPPAQHRSGALRVFSDSAYYKALTGGTGGLTQAEVDGKVGEVLAQ